MEEIVRLLKKEWHENWHDDAKNAFDEFLKSGKRYYQKARDSVQIRCNKQDPSNGAPFLALIHPDNPEQGAYGGMSFVVFPRTDGEAFFGLVVGTEGLAPDSTILGRPGHARRNKAICSWLNKELAEKERVAWYKNDPCDTGKNFIKDVDNEFGLPENLVKRYAHVIYSLVNVANILNEEALEKAIKAFLDFSFQERGIDIQKRQLSDANAIKANYLNCLFPKVSSKEVQNILNERRYVILEGPPGTGKTEMALQLKEENYGGTGKSIQFHPNVTYEDFVGGLKPVQGNNSMGFAFAPVPGTLMEAAKEANTGNYLLHIDEINRADLASVLGEAIYLFEPHPLGKRQIDLAYDFNEPYGTTLSLPENLHVLGTMNSADRSIAIMDIAIRRRFSFVKLWPDADIVKEKAPPICQELFFALLDLFVDYATDDSCDLMPGHSYFLPSPHESPVKKLQTELRPLLNEYLAQGHVAGFADEIHSFLQLMDAKCAQLEN